MLKHCKLGTIFLAVIFFVLCTTAAFAAGNVSIAQVRFNSDIDHDRVVFDLERMVHYEAKSTDDGRCIVLYLDGADATKIHGDTYGGAAVERISYTETERGITAKIYLKKASKFKVDTLLHPARIFVDVMHAPIVPKTSKYDKNKITDKSKTNADNKSVADSEKITPDEVAEADKELERLFIKPVPREIADDDEEKPIRPVRPIKTPATQKTEPDDTKQTSKKSRLPAVNMRQGPTPDYTVFDLAPGLTETLYSRWNDDGPVQAYFIEADKSKFALKPALDDGQVLGRGTVSYIADEYNAVAAVNASYFGSDGTIIGLMKIDGIICGTTYYKRGSIGIMPDGSAIFGQPIYSGLVNLGGVSIPVGGVDAPRGEDTLVIYNRFYGNTTRTNDYGQEYIVRDGKVIGINNADTKIPYDAQVISVHGTIKDALAGVKIGDSVEILENIGGKWNEAVHILGAGPCLVERGRVRVSSGEEKFLPDVAYGRAPRSAVGITKKGNFVLAVVDGRSSESHGCTLTEWANLLREYGCYEAINLDGGGSSAIVAQGKLLNSPSDGGERRVGSALIILPK